MASVVVPFPEPVLRYFVAMSVLKKRAALVGGSLSRLLGEEVTLQRAVLETRFASQARNDRSA